MSVDLAAIVLKHLLQAEKPLTYKELCELTERTYFPVREAVRKLKDNNKLVIEGPKRGKEQTFKFNPDSDKSLAAEAYIQAAEKLDLLSELIGDKVIFLGWKKTNRKPIEDWLKIFSSSTRVLDNAKTQTMIIPLIMKELYEIAIDEDDKPWIKEAKLKELRKVTIDAEKTFKNLITFIGQLLNCGWVWDARYINRYLIEKPKVDPEEMLEYCKRIEEIYGEPKDSK